ncbi:MAG: glycosyltransferase family 2 protein [Bacteroidota bacterium]
MKKISIITVNFNQPRVTRELLQSIQQVNTYKDIEIIVVDNGSQTGPVTELVSQFPDVQFIRSDVNLGFAGGNNIGINAATGDYLFLVNNDTEFTADLVQKLVDVLDQHPEAGMVSPRINYFSDKTLIQYAGFTQVNYFTARNSAVGKQQRNGDEFNKVIGPTAYAHGAALMVKREAIEKAGLMFENYFLYYEEVDWCERVKRAGYQIWMRGDAVIYHKESVSVGKNSWLKEYFMNRNRILFIRRNAPLFARLVFYVYFMLMVAPRNVIGYIKSGNYNFIGYLFKAIWWNITHSRNSKSLGITLK